MNYRILFFVNAIIAVLLGLGFLVVPSSVLAPCENVRAGGRFLL